MTMSPFLRRRFFPAVITTLLVVLAQPASAQWMWKDAGGHVIASDQPPPPGTPQADILKQPRKRAASTVVAPADAEKDGSRADTKADQKTQAPKSLADRDLDAKQQAKADADAAKKAEDDANRAKAMQANCSAVRSNLAALQAGGRAARYNEKGEKVYIDDAQRQDEINKQQAQVAQYCR